MSISSWLVRWFHRGRVDVGTEALAQPLDRRIRLERSRGAHDLVLLLKQALPRGRSEGRLNRFERNANIAAEILRQSLQKSVLDEPCAPVSRRFIELQR